MLETQEPKIAVCFSGLPRLVPSATAKWQEFLLKNNADVFVHTWLLDEEKKLKIIGEISEKFNAKLLKIEIPRKLNVDLYKDSDRIWPYRSEPKNVLSMWTSLSESINLALSWSKNKNVHYDLIIRARFDWWCESLVLERNEGLTVPDSPGLYGHRFKYKGVQYTAHNDQFGYGSPNVMEQYAKTVERIPRLFAFDGVDFCSELLLTANMISQNIKVNYQKNMECGIVK